MTSRLWWVFASAVAWSLAQVIGAPTRTEPIPRPQPRTALAPAPRRLELPYYRKPPPWPEPRVHDDLPDGLMELWPEHRYPAGHLTRLYLSGTTRPEPRPPAWSTSK